MIMSVIGGSLADFAIGSVTECGKKVAKQTQASAAKESDIAKGKMDCSTCHYDKVGGHP